MKGPIFIKPNAKLHGYASGNEAALAAVSVKQAEPSAPGDAGVSQKYVEGTPFASGIWKTGNEFPPVQAGTGPVAGYAVVVVVGGIVVVVVGGIVVGLGTVEADLVSTLVVEVVEDEESVPVEQAAVSMATAKMPAAALSICILEELRLRTATPSRGSSSRGCHRPLTHVQGPRQDRDCAEKMGYPWRRVVGST